MRQLGRGRPSGPEDLEVHVLSEVRQRLEELDSVPELPVGDGERVHPPVEADAEAPHPIDAAHEDGETSPCRQLPTMFSTTPTSEPVSPTTDTTTGPEVAARTNDDVWPALGSSKNPASRSSAPAAPWILVWIRYMTTWRAKLPTFTAAAVPSMDRATTL